MAAAMERKSTGLQGTCHEVAKDSKPLLPKAERGGWPMSWQSAATSRAYCSTLDSQSRAEVRHINRYTVCSTWAERC